MIAEDQIPGVLLQGVIHRLSRVDALPSEGETAPLQGAGQQHSVRLGVFHQQHAQLSRGARQSRINEFGAILHTASPGEIASEVTNSTSLNSSAFCFRTSSAEFELRNLKRLWG